MRDTMRRLLRWGLGLYLVTHGVCIAADADPAELAGAVLAWLRALPFSRV